MKTKKHLLQIVLDHNSIIKTLETLDIKIPAKDFLKIQNVSEAITREGWAIMDALLEAGINGAKIDAQSGHITLPASEIIRIYEEEGGVDN